MAWTTDHSAGATSSTGAADRITRREAAVAAAVESRLVTEEQPVVALLDTETVRQAVADLRGAFDAVTTEGQRVLHTFAVKAGSLVPVLTMLNELGVGAEVASPGELALARAAGVSADQIVLDSPAKTTTELREALDLGIALNADNPQELARLDELIGTSTPRAAVGVRINPQLGAGSIDAMSTATATSKFGVAMRDEGAREWVHRAYAERPWLTRLHCHVGSQGMPLAQMVAGVRATYELAEEINDALVATAGRRQIDTIDIGGGLPVNFDSDELSPTYTEYAALLRAEVPGLFDGRYGIVTEFGRSLLAKAGVIVARVEYAKSAGGRRIAVTHAGAQVATRTVFMPDAWPLRVAAYDAQGKPKSGPDVAQDVAGPCCFAGDLVARDRKLPELEAGDYAGLLDTGAYYASTHFAYNSLPRPGFYGFTSRDDGVEFTTIRRPQTIEELVEESGGPPAES